MTSISEVARTFFSRSGFCALVGIMTLMVVGCPSAATSGGGGGGGADPIDFEDIISRHATTGAAAAEYESADLSGPLYGEATYDGGSALSSVESRTFHFSFTAEEVGDNLYSVETTDGMTMSIGVVSNIILVEFVDPAGGAGRAWGKATDTTWSRMEGRMAYDDGSLAGEWILMTGTPPPGW